MIPVTVTLQYLRLGEKVLTRMTLSMDARVGDTVLRLIDELKLPAEEGGQPLSYHLIRQRLILDDGATLFESGVQEGDILQVATVDPQATMGFALAAGVLSRIGSGKAGTEPLSVPATLIAETGEKFPLRHARALIGRADAKLGYPPEALDADLTDLDPDRTVSRPHALIVYHEGEFTIRDLYSQRGLLVNGVRVSPSKAQVLHNADMITLGNVRIQFRRDS